MEKEKTAIDRVLAEMTPEQKLAQIQGMFCGSDAIPPEMLNRFPDGLGAIATITCGDSPEKQIAEAEEQQRILIENCGIPSLRHIEAVTGVVSPAGTVFPSAIGLGATWNPDTVEKMADIIRKQMLSVGLRQALSPVMDVARDPRWGRIGETYGEDPTLCAAMSVAYTKGLQTENLSEGVLATAKHFLGYGMSEGGLNMAANPIPDRELREVYAKPFQAAITEAHLGSVMNSYGSVDGDLIIGSEKILTELLRDEMGFEGVTVSDYMSVNKLVDLKLSDTPVKAGKKALEAGMDVELPMPYGYTKELLDVINEDEELSRKLDNAVRRILEMKEKMGLFERPGAHEELLGEAYDMDVTAPHNLQAARESIVLLENDGILPLSKDISKIAVIGPHADSIRLLFGCYTYPAAFDRDTTGAMADMPGMQGVSQRGDNPNQQPYLPGSTVRASFPPVEEHLKDLYADRTITILEAIRRKCPHAQIRYEKGCDVAGNDRSGFDVAVEAARNADVVIVTGGGKYGWGGNCTTGEGIDCDRIGLTGVQEQLAEEISRTGTPAVYIHMDIKPLCSEYICGNYNAVLENWFPGETGGMAIADVLFGDYNPAGRLPVTAVRNEGQIPIYASQRNGSGYMDESGMVISKYVEGTKMPLYYFGEGKSYSSFRYSDLEITKDVNVDGTVEVSCTVENVSDIDGEEVVQLYVTDELASMLRPGQELAGFCRTCLKSGERKRLHFSMKADQFAFLDKDMHWLTEAGDMTVKIGSSSKDIRLTGKFRITESAYIDGKNRGFYAKVWEDEMK